MRLITAIVLSLHALSVAAADKPKDKKPAAPARPLTWPLPPEQPRIRYVTSYHGSDDFKTKKAGRWKTALLGQDPSASVPVDTLVKPFAVAVGPNGRV